MAECLPLSALLSQVLVAFTIEFDNEFEHQTPHRTTNHGSTAASGSAPWLVSMTMWTMFMRFIADEGISVRDFQQKAGLQGKEMRIWLTRMSQWWGYVTIQKTAGQRARDWTIVPTSGGRKALAVWRPLTHIIEQRWEKRFGKRVVQGLRQSSRELVRQFNADLPAFLPILGYDMFSHLPDPPRNAGHKGSAAPLDDDGALPCLLSKALMAFAVEYENQSHLSLAISANVLRVAEMEVRFSDLPRLAGVSKEAVSMAIKRLQENGLAGVHTHAGSRQKLVSLTDRGKQARNRYSLLVSEIEQRWQTSFGPCVSEVRSRIESLSPGLLAAVKPYPDGWRASLPRPEVIPHYPMILHRGGFPDGS